MTAAAPETNVSETAAESIATDFPIVTLPDAEIAYRTRRLQLSRHFYVVRTVLSGADGETQSWIRQQRPAALKLADRLRAQGYAVEVFDGSVTSWSRLR